jgi:regulator of replication initiation timing
VDDPKLQALMTENSKLQYQLSHLKQAVEGEKAPAKPKPYSLP